jgi:hypothetical protein
MAYEGADIEKLRVAAGQMDSVANALESSAKNVHSTVTNAAAWWGSDADKFRSQWTSVSRPNIDAAVAALRLGASSLRRNAAEQEQVSSRAGGAGPVPTASTQSTPAPVGTAHLLQHIDNSNKQGDGVHIEKVVGPDGRTRLIAYFQGQDSTSNRSGIPGDVRDAKLLTGGVDKQALQDIRNALSSCPDGGNTDIMLVGLSQGGMDAQNIAAQAKSLNLHVTNVVTYGSPITVPDAPGVQTVHLQATQDVIPYAGEIVQGAILGAIGGPGLAVDAGLLNMARDQLQPSIYHDLSTAPPSIDHSAYYPSVAQDFDNSNDARFAGVKESMKKFQGDIVDVYGLNQPS